MINKHLNNHQMIQQFKYKMNKTFIVDSINDSL